MLHFCRGNTHFYELVKRLVDKHGSLNSNCVCLYIYIYIIPFNKEEIFWCLVENVIGYCLRKRGSN